MTSPEPLLVAAHVGQSRAEVVCPQLGWTLTLPGIHTDLPLAPQFEALVRRILELYPALSEPGFTLSIGAAGARDNENVDEVMARLRHLGVLRLHLTHDSTTSYLGALGNQQGVVTASGTGVITLAVGRSSVARVDGWGWIIGDAGSGFWIGRRGLEAVMRAHDGRGPATSLTEMIGSDFHDPEQAYLELQADHDKVARIARYAVLVISAADTGDVVATRICHEAARELAVSAMAALHRVGLDKRGTPLAAFTGGVMASSLIHDSLRAQFCQMAPWAQMVAARGTALDGAVALPEVDPDTPLGRRVLIAR